LTSLERSRWIIPQVSRRFFLSAVELETEQTVAGPGI